MREPPSDPDDAPIPEEDLLAWHSDALTPANRREVGRQLGLSREAQGTLDEWNRQDAAIRALYGARGDEALSPALAQMLEAARAEAPQAPPRRRPPPLGLLAAGLVVLVAGIASGWFLHAARAPMPDAAAEAAQAFRTYAGEGAHAVELPAGTAGMDDWASRRLGRAIHAPDLGRAGFTLLGLRVLPSPVGPAVLYLYEDGAGRRLALFAHPQGGGLSSPEPFAAAGTRGFWWRARAVTYVVAGAAPVEEMRQAATMAYDQLL